MKKLTTILAAAAAPLALGGVLLSTAGQASAAAAPAVTMAAVVQHESLSKFTGGQGEVFNLRDAGGLGVVLYDPNNASYAGLKVSHPADYLPVTAPTGTYTELGSPSGGAPRIEFNMANGDQVTGYAYPAVADGTTVNTIGQFDVQNGPSGYHYNMPWSGVVALEQGVKIKSEDVLSDTYTGPTFVVIKSLDDGTARLIG